MQSTPPFHEGELQVQERAGSVKQGRNSGRLISTTMVPGAIKFLRKLPFVVIGSVDEQDNLWASLLLAESGFLQAEPHEIRIDLSRAWRNHQDPLWKNLDRNARVGLLAIDLRTRARLRVNGQINFPTQDLLQLTVEQAYPNCPQYIQRRDFRPALQRTENLASQSASGRELLPEQLSWIARADTFFVASRHLEQGLDASHRGGNPGFIQVLSPTVLRIPDYAGNGMFNTLGNFVSHPRAGILIPDFEKGRTLQLSGRPEILHDLDDPDDNTGGTHRVWNFTVESWIEIQAALPGSVEFLDYSPFNPPRERTTAEGT